MAQLVYTITGNNTGLATAVNNSIGLIGKLQAAIDKLNATSFDGLAASLTNATSSLNGLLSGIDRANAGLASLNQTVNNNTQNFNTLNQTYNNTSQSINQVNVSVASLNQTFNAGTQGLSGARGGLLGLNSSYAALFAAVAVVRKVVNSNAEISDSLSDVRRTAQLTAQETDNLFKSLEKIDSRTSLKGLIDIATIGGQLGIAKDQLAGFTRATDLLNVALKGEIEGGPDKIAKGLGILNNVFKISDKEGGDVEKAFNQIGSSILGLGQSGLATGDFLVKFGEKVGGVAAQAKLSLPVLLSYGAVLQEQGVTAEVAGTAFKKLLAGLGTKPAKFLAVAQIADSSLTLKQFTDLINTDTQQALQLFFEGLAKGGPTTTSFLSLLKSVGLDAARSGQAISAIALNLDDLHKHVEQSNIDFDNASKAAEQAALKNDTLAASIEKLSKAFVELTTGSSLGSFFKTITDGITGSIKALDKFFLSLKRLGTNSNGLGFLANLSATGLGENSLEKIDDIQNSFVNSEDAKNAFLTKNPITGNGEFPSLKGQSAEQLKKQLAAIQVAYQSAYHAYSQYFDGVKAGIFNDDNVGITGGLSRTKQTAEDILYIYNKIKATLDALPVPKAGTPVTLPDKVKKASTSGISQDEFLNRLQTFNDGINSDQSGLSGLDATLQKIEDKYKLHFDRLDALRIQLDKSNKITDKQRVSDEAAIATEENTLLSDKAKEISDARVKEAQRVSNEIQRISDEFGIKAEQSRGRELAAIQARYDAEVRKAKGNAAILSAIEAGRLNAIQQVNDKYQKIQDDLYFKIGEIEDQAIGATKVKLESETDRILIEWEKRRKAANDYYDTLKKIAASTPNNPADVLPGLTNAFSNLNLARQQNTTNRFVDSGESAATIKNLTKEFTDQLSTGLVSAGQNIFGFLTTLGQKRTDVENKYALQLKDQQDAFAESQAANDGKISAAQNQEAVDRINKLKSLEEATTTSFKAIFSDVVANINASFANIFENILAKGLTTSLSDSITQAAISGQISLTTNLQDGIVKGTAGLSGALSSRLIAGIAAAGLAGSLISGATSKTSVVGQGLGGALSGAATGALVGTALFPVGGTVIGAVAGGVIGLLGGIFGASKAQKEAQAQQLAEAKQQTELLRQSIAYTSTVIGRMTASGLISDLSVGATGQLTAKVSGKDLQFILDRNGR